MSAPNHKINQRSPEEHQREFERQCRRDRACARNLRWLQENDTDGLHAALRVLAKLIVKNERAQQEGK